MISLDLLGIDLLGLSFLVVFFLLIIVYALLGRKRLVPNLREIPAFRSLGYAIGLAVEAGTRLHLTLGRGGLLGIPAGSALIGLKILDRLARTASVSDLPPIATSGEGSLGILSQDTLYNSFQAVGQGAHYEPSFGQVSGLTPFAYAAGTIPVILDENVSTTILSGHFGSEVALITDASERAGARTLAGSDDLTAQAVLFATAQEPLIGEELYAAGAYLKSGSIHIACVRAQDVLRWTIILAILLGAILKFLQVL